MDLLRFATAGSVDDGKSTLIGRLLLDSKAVFADQLESVENSSKSKGFEYTDLSLLTDGLRSEREQGITIDVAYRYFATPNRKFIIADTPGHVQYTRNMVTGASTADLGLVLVDARQGLTEQSRRHAVLLSLLRVPHLVLAVNKMDLVDYDEKRYQEIRDEFQQFATKLSIPDLEVIPISALKGDNVVVRSENMPWYQGTSLIHHLENVHVASDKDFIDTRFPVQYVVRPKSDKHHDYRGYAGMVAGGVMKPGDEVLVLPSGLTSRIAGIDLGDKEISEAFPPMSVTVRLEDDVDVSRGDMICREKNAPKPSQDIDAMICWMHKDAMKVRQKLAIKHTTRTGRALVKDIQYRLDVNTLHRDQDSKELGLERGWPRATTYDNAPACVTHTQRTEGHGFVYSHRRRHRSDDGRWHDSLESDEDKAPVISSDTTFRTSRRRALRNETVSLRNSRRQPTPRALFETWARSGSGQAATAFF